MLPLDTNSIPRTTWYTHDLPNHEISRFSAARRRLTMDCCAQCKSSNDTVEFGDYFRCDHDSEIRWKTDTCDQFEQRIGVFEDFAEEDETL